MCDGGDLLRRLCFILSENSKGTPIEFWLQMPLSELMTWIETNNDLIHERVEALKHSSRRR